jgi:hypothetical protein
MLLENRLPPAPGGQQMAPQKCQRKSRGHHTPALDVVIERLKQHGCDPKPVGAGQWRSRCPGHEDRNPSLSIKEEADGKVLIHCFAGCAFGDILAPLGITAADLRVGEAPSRPPGKTSAKPKRNGAAERTGRAYATPEAAIAFFIKEFGEPTEHWTYHRANGDEFMRVYRFDLDDGSKQFRPIHPDVNGHWHTGDPSVLLLYHLPEIRDAEMVCVLEGEKCCDVVRAMGLTATTSAHGAAAAARSNWAPLAGKNVVLVPDNDKAGERYIAEVAALLQKLDPAPQIWVRRLPLDREGDDIEQWVQAQGALAPAQLRAAFDAIETLLWGDVKFATGDAVLRESSADQWLWRSWIPAASICGIAAPEGVGKTRTALDLCARIYLGKPWPDKTPMTLPRGTKSVWVCADGNHEEVVNTALNFGMPASGIVFPAPEDDARSNTCLDDPETLDWIKRAVIEYQAALVVVDSLTLATQQDLCTQKGVAKLVAPLKVLAQELRIAIVLLMHVAREGNALGRRIKGATRTLIHLEATDLYDPDRLRLWVEKSFDRKPMALGVALGETGNHYDGSPPPPRTQGDRGRPPESRSAVEEFILRSLSQKGDQVWTDLQEACEKDKGVSKTTFWRAVESLKQSGQVATEGGPGTGRQMILTLGRGA